MKLLFSLLEKPSVYITVSFKTIICHTEMYIDVINYMHKYIKLLIYLSKVICNHTTMLLEGFLPKNCSCRLF